IKPPKGLSKSHWTKKHHMCLSRHSSDTIWNSFSTSRHRLGNVTIPNGKTLQKKANKTYTSCLSTENLSGAATCIPTKVKTLRRMEDLKTISRYGFTTVYFWKIKTTCLSLHRKVKQSL